MTGPELVRELAAMADRLEEIRAELPEGIASGELAPVLGELVPTACRLGADASWLAREVYTRSCEVRAPWWEVL